MKILPKALALTCTAAMCIGSVWAQDTTKLLVWGDAPREPFYKAFDESRDDVELEFVSIARNELIQKLQLAIRSCLLYTSPSPRDQRGSRMPSSA